MIEICNNRGKKILIHKKDVKDISEKFDGRYPSIRSIITLYDGSTISCCMDYKVVKTLILDSIISRRELFNDFYKWLDDMSEAGYDGMSLTEKCEKFFFDKP